MRGKCLISFVGSANARARSYILFVFVAQLQAHNAFIATPSTPASRWVRWVFRCVCKKYVLALSSERKTLFPMAIKPRCAYTLLLNTYLYRRNKHARTHKNYARIFWPSLSIWLQLCSRMDSACVACVRSASVCACASFLIKIPHASTHPPPFGDDAQSGVIM